MTFEYTERYRPLSTVVEEIFYNDHDREMLVTVEGGNCYLYKGVPLGVYTDFKKHWSVGRFYNMVIKPEYGPAECLGYNPGVEEKVYPAPVMAAVGTPKGLKLAPDAIVDGVREYNVYFTVEGGSIIKSYLVKATGFGEAAKALEEVGEALQITFDVKTVSVVE